MQLLGNGRFKVAADGGSRGQLMDAHRVDRDVAEATSSVPEFYASVHRAAAEKMTVVFINARASTRPSETKNAAGASGSHRCSAPHSGVATEAAKQDRRMLPLADRLAAINSHIGLPGEGSIIDQLAAAMYRVGYAKTHSMQIDVEALEDFLFSNAAPSTERIHHDLCKRVQTTADAIGIPINGSLRSWPPRRSTS